MIADPRRLAWLACTAMVLIAAPTSAGLRIVGPAPPSQPWSGLEIGPRISLAVPTGLAGKLYDRGINAGVTVAARQGALFGGSLDFSYSRWASPAAGASLDALFSALGSAPVTGTEASLTMFQVSGHVRLSPLPGRNVQPWIQAGMGVSRANRYLKVPVAQLSAAGWQVEEPVSNDISYQPLGQTGVGFDVKTGQGMKIGLDASYEWQMFASESDPFTAYTIGGHVLFGRR